MCGASAEEQAAAQPLARRMSEMLIAFAGRSNPNCKEVPHWSSYDLKERNTMIFDTETRAEKDPRGVERGFAAGAHYRQPRT
jgi:para-nitrobenzyl esterase